MFTDLLFYPLEQTDSTNNYAVERIHAGLAKHGMAWFAFSQNKGKGQRGKHWLSKPGENIILSVALNRLSFFKLYPFVFNAHIANVCRKFLAEQTHEEIKIKWPNDLYLYDKKTGGILIENIYRGKDWKWSVVGIGINVNQMDFPPEIPNPISLRKATNILYDALSLAKKLHLLIIDSFVELKKEDLNKIIIEYNKNLYKKSERVKLKRNNVVFETVIGSVNEFGELQVDDVMERKFRFGEIEWVT